MGDDDFTAPERGLESIRERSSARIEGTSILAVLVENRQRGLELERER